MSRPHVRWSAARIIGLGVANNNVVTWLVERATAIVLLPLSVWLVASIIAHTGSDYPAFMLWMRRPLTTILMVLLLIVLFHHTALGLQVVIEDYIHSAAKTAVLVAMRITCATLALIGITAVVLIAFAG
jgi:succinate dehydrogenase / fumarate reductase membrane anchor subunit